MNEIPPEILCKITSNLNNYKDIVSFSSVNRHVRESIQYEKVKSLDKISWEIRIEYHNDYRGLTIHNILVSIGENAELPLENYCKRFNWVKDNIIDENFICKVDHYEELHSIDIMNTVIKGRGGDIIKQLIKCPKYAPVWFKFDKIRNLVYPVMISFKNPEGIPEKWNSSLGRHKNIFYDEVNLYLGDLIVNGEGNHNCNHLISRTGFRHPVWKNVKSSKWNGVNISKLCIKIRRNKGAKRRRRDYDDYDESDEEGYGEEEGCDIFSKRRRYII